MSFAKVEIEITDVPTLNGAISIQIDSEPLYISEQAKTSRTGPGTFRRLEAPQPLEANVFELANAIDLDYTPGGLLASYPINVTVDGFKVVITATEYGHSFALITTPATWNTVTITPEVPPTPTLEIGVISVSEADGVDKCNNVKYSFTVSDAVHPVYITGPVVKTCNTPADLFFDFSRYPIPSDTLDITDSDSGSDSKALQRVSTFDITTANISVIESFQGGTATITPQVVNSGDVGLTYTYSLDGIDYDASNVFFGLTPATYTAYVKDQFGCIKTASFEVVGVPIDKPEPIFEIQNTNGLKFFKSVSSFDYKTTFPFLDNADINSQEIFNTQQRCYKQLVQTNDTSTVQIQSNYETVTAEVRKLSDDSVVLNPVPTIKTTNVLINDKRDAKIIGGEDDTTYIYFPGGNLYEPESGTYENPSLRLPEFLDAGTIASGVTVTLSDNAVLNGTFKVLQSVIFELDGGNVYGLQIQAVYTGGASGTDVICDSLYNALDYNVWEFSVNWGALGIEEIDYYIVTNGTDVDPRYNPIEWCSEPVNVDSRQIKTAYIEYSNTANFSNMDYSTGIVNFLRLPARFMRYSSGGEREAFETDSGNVIELKSINTRDIVLETSLIPQYLVEKIQLMSGHDNITINGQKCAQQEKGEGEALFDEQNRMYTYTGTFRLDSTTVITDTSGIVGQSDSVLGGDSGTVIGV